MMRNKQRVFLIKPEGAKKPIEINNKLNYEEQIFIWIEFDDRHG
jgi:hypothetical protein